MYWKLYFILLGAVSLTCGEQVVCRLEVRAADPVKESAKPKETPRRTKPLTRNERAQAEEKEEILHRLTDEKLFPPLDEKLREQIKTDVENLADNEKIAAAAQADLLKIGPDALPQLAVAAKSEKTAIAERANHTIDQLFEYTCKLIDATGQRIVGAKVEFDLGDGKTQTYQTDRFGHLALPPAVAADLRKRTSGGDRSAVPMAIISHPDYGKAIASVYVFELPTPQLPLVNKTSKAYELALRGIIQTTDGQPVVGARISVARFYQKHGDSLLSGARIKSLSDEHGKFSYFFLNSSDTPRPEVVTAGSLYLTEVETPDDPTIFPHLHAYSNSGFSQIILQRPTKEYAVSYDNKFGELAELKNESEPRRSFRLKCFPADSGISPLTVLEGIDITNRIVDGKIKLVEATYGLTPPEISGGGEKPFFPKIDVTSDGPNELAFHQVVPGVVSGRVVDGITGKPLAKALVMTIRDTSRPNLSRMSAKDWEGIRKDVNSVRTDGFRRLREEYLLNQIVLTGADGSYELKTGELYDSRPFALVAMDEMRLPYRVNLTSIKLDESRRGKVDDIPLFQAAKISARVNAPPLSKPGNITAPTPQTHHVALMRWEPAGGDRPAWYERLLAAQQSGMRELEPMFVRVDKTDTALVPAGVKVVPLFFEIGLTGSVTNCAADAVNLKPGETKELGAVELVAPVKLAVQVVEAKQAAVAGVAVKCQLDDISYYSRRTDSKGLVDFDLRPNCHGAIIVSGFPASYDWSKAENLSLSFEVKDASLKEPLKITLTDEQIKLINRR